MASSKYVDLATRVVVGMGSLSWFSLIWKNSLGLRAMALYGWLVQQLWVPLLCLVGTRKLAAGF
jgi:hypothetical protein